MAELKPIKSPVEDMIRPIVGDGRPRPPDEMGVGRMSVNETELACSVHARKA